MEAPKTMAWFNKKMIPPEVVTEIFDICDRPCSVDNLIRLQSFIDAYSIETIDNLSHPEYQLNPLLMAMDGNHLDKAYRVAQLLFTAGSDLSKRSPHGFSVLLAGAGNEDCINILHKFLIRGGNPNSVSTDNQTALGIAVLMFNLDAVKMLLHYEANTMLENGHALVMWVDSFWHIPRQELRERQVIEQNKGEDILVELVNAGAQLNELVWGKGYSQVDALTPIQWVEFQKDIGRLSKRMGNKLIKMLIKHGADPNVK